jgi:hypothetical protein
MCYVTPITKVTLNAAPYSMVVVSPAVQIPDVAVVDFYSPQSSQRLHTPVTVVAVDATAVLQYQEFLTTLRSEVPKFARARVSQQEDHPHQQQQQQHYLTPPPAAHGSAAAADVSCGLKYEGLVCATGTRSHAGAGSGVLVNNNSNNSGGTPRRNSTQRR